VIPIQTPAGSIFGSQRWKVNNLTRACTPRSHLVYSGQSPSPSAYSLSKVNQWLVMRAQSHKTQWAQPIHLLYKVKGGDTREQSKGAFTLNIGDHLSLTTSLESTPLDCAKFCHTVYKPLFGLLVYCSLLGPIKIIQQHTLFTLFLRSLSLT